MPNKSGWMKGPRKMKPNASQTTTALSNPAIETGTQLGALGAATTSSSGMRGLPSVTPQHGKSLSPQGLTDHRQKIAFEARVVLSAYFQPHEAEEIRAAQLAWWCDELQDWTQEQVVWGLRKWNRANPDKRPTPGHIVAILKEARGRKIAAQLPKPNPEPERKRPSPEQAAAILAQAGFSVRKMDPAP
jgi:hypothetical protein